MKSIKTKLIMFIILIVFISLGLLTVISYLESKSTIMKNTEESVSMQSVTASKQLNLWLTTHKTELEMIANSPVIAGGDKDAIINYLKQENDRLKVYKGIFVSDAEGNWYSTTGATGTIKDRDYYHQVMDTGNTVVSNPVYSKSTGDLALVVAAPIKQNGKTIGLVGSNLLFNEMQQLVSSDKIGEKGSAYMIQNDGTIIVHDDVDKVMKDNLLQDDSIPKELKEAAQKMVKGESGIINYRDTDGVDKYSAYVPLEGTGWTLVVNASINDLTKGLKSLGLTSLILTLVVISISSFVSIIFAQKIAKPIEQISKVAGEVSKGNLSNFDMKVQSKDEIGVLTQSFKLMIDNLKQLISDVHENVEQVAASSEELTAISEQSAQASSQVASVISDVAQGADMQLSSIANATVIVEQMSNKIYKIAENTSSVSNMANRTANASKDGSQSINKVISQMENIEKTVTSSANVVTKLGYRSKEIGQIVDTISSIAEQTNLLALNAAIEAARAGEQGKGFAVVAEEIRKLAEQSQNSTKKITELINAIQIDTNQAVTAMDEGTQAVKSGSSLTQVTGRVFNEIETLVNQLTEQVKEINNVIHELGGSSKDVVSTMNEIDKISNNTVEQTQLVSASIEEQAASTEEVAASSNSLAKLSEKLLNAIGKFKM